METKNLVYERIAKLPKKKKFLLYPIDLRCRRYFYFFIVPKMNAIITKHNLDFLVADYQLQTDLDSGIIWKRFKVGTVSGLWGCDDYSYLLLAFINDEPGNGHLDDVFEWFEFAAKRDKKNIVIMEFLNDRFKKHCITKRGFLEAGKNVVKFFR